LSLRVRHAAPVLLQRPPRGLFLFRPAPLGVLGLIPCFRLLALPQVQFLAAALLGRRPWLTQRRGDACAKVDDRLAVSRSIRRPLPKVAPVHILARADCREHGVVAPYGFVRERRDRDVEDRKDEVVPAEGALAREERVELEFAVPAVDRARGDDRNEETRAVDRRGDLGLPHLSGRDRALVLPKAEILLCAAELSAQLLVDRLAQRGERTPEIVVVIARIAEEAGNLGKLSKRGHGNNARQSQNAVA